MRAACIGVQIPACDDNQRPPLAVEYVFVQQFDGFSAPRYTGYHNGEASMPNLIALITRLDRNEEDAWLAPLRSAMPDERVVSLQSLEPSQCMEVGIAIVANPDPADVRRLPNLALIQSLWAGVERLVDQLEPSAPPIARMVDPEMARTMSEAVLAWTYYLQRDMPAYAAQQREKVWRPLPYRKPSDMTLGLLVLISVQN